MYQGAGILFFTQSHNETSVLLGQRRRSGVWSIPGGRWHESDSDPWATAYRETVEEFGSVPTGHQERSSLRYPFGLFGFDWTTFLLEVPDPPAIAAYPDRQAQDFHVEFRDAAWFPIHSLPPKTHWLLYPLIWKLRKRG
jgi:8-oxo-dGTP pyrophosphatase MutT (NUDIX family)